MRLRVSKENIDKALHNFISYGHASDAEYRLFRDSAKMLSHILRDIDMEHSAPCGGGTSLRDLLPREVEREIYE